MSNVKKVLKKLFSDKRFIIMLIILVVLVIAAIVIYNIKYSPTDEKMTINEYYEVKDGEMAVILDGELLTKSEGSANAIVRDDTPYVRYNLIGDALNDVYAYDSREHKVNYTTKEGTYSATAGAKGYTFKGQNTSTDYSPLVEENGTGYLALEFVKDTCGMEYAFAKDPARCALYTPGIDRTTATISSDIEMRRFGGNRSKILAVAKKKDKVTVVENYGSWSQILTEDAVLGCIPNGYIKDKETEANKTGVAQESMKHNLMKEKIRMGWHQIFTGVANSELNNVLSIANGMNVICPTWFQIKDSRGGITNFASTDYVNTCHSRGIKVWALVNNLEKNVDESSVFGVTSNRENLVNNVVNAAVAAGVDGINVDIESVGDSNVEGYVEFIKQLALKCNENNLILSVDNYNINSADYDVDVQARFADYIVLFGYDETWTGAQKAGSNNSINYVKKGVEGMLESGVDKSQLILAIPFYTRLWKQTGSGLTSEVVLLKDTPNLLSSNNVSATWLKDNKENYAEWTSGDTKNMIWIVDNKSLKERVDYAVSKGLAGVSAWKLGNETADTWTMISDTMK